MVPRKYLEKLRAELAGRVLEAGDPGYDQSLVIDNGRIDLRPGIVVKCANAQDVVTAYKFAVEHDMHFTVRGGGHSAAGYCLRYEKDHFIVLAELGEAGRAFPIDKSTVVAGRITTGARLRILYVETPEGPLAQRIGPGPVNPMSTPGR